MVALQYPSTLNRLSTRGIPMRRSILNSLAAVAVLVGFGSDVLAEVIVSQGYVVPETISQAPDSFGSYGGSYFIPDRGTGEIKVMPETFGNPAVFQQTANQSITGGLFLPTRSEERRVGKERGGLSA